MGSFPYVIRVFVVCRLTVRREYFFSFSHLTLENMQSIELEGDSRPPLGGLPFITQHFLFSYALKKLYVKAPHASPIGETLQAWGFSCSEFIRSLSLSSADLSLVNSSRRKRASGTRTRHSDPTLCVLTNEIAKPKRVLSTRRRLKLRLLYEDLHDPRPWISVFHTTVSGVSNVTLKL
jgi:hypothetical protein